MYGSAQAQNWILARSSAGPASELPVLTISSCWPSRATDDPIVWVPERPLLFSGDLLFRGGTGSC